jgi:hypothetical protein
MNPRFNLWCKAVVLVLHKAPYRRAPTRVISSNLRKIGANSSDLTNIYGFLIRQNLAEVEDGIIYPTPLLHSVAETIEL